MTTPDLVILIGGSAVLTGVVAVLLFVGWPRRRALPPQEPLLYRTKEVEDFAGSLVKTTEKSNTFVISSRSRVELQPTLEGKTIVRDYGKERADYEAKRDTQRIEAAMRAGFTLNEARANLGLLVDNDGASAIGIAFTKAPEPPVQVLKPFVAPSRKRAPVSVEETP